MSHRNGPAAGEQTARTDLSSYLTQQVMDLIRVGNLRPGDRLPTAKALAERFAVATPTIREALRRLQALGVVDIRHGSGIYVRPGTERFLLANPDQRLFDAGKIPQLLDARLLIEPYLARLAALRIDYAGLDRLQSYLDEAGKYLSASDEPLMHATMAFHSAIAAASGNSVLSDIIGLLIDLYSSEQLAITSLYNARVEDHREHLEILAALRERDPDRVAELMRRHLAGVKAVVEARLEGSPEDYLVEAASRSNDGAPAIGSGQ
jgi:GntR family transcriptional repressor for pyruvate dehydrogenase complex